ncbi:MAG: hypothetical protein ABFD89_26515 [Bryobacteraceae bacterium]
MQPSEGSGADTNGGGMRASIERFLGSSRRPALLEPGLDPFPLEAERYILTGRGDTLTIQVWDDTRNLVRRIVGIESEKPGRIELHIERFGKRAGRLTLVDLARPTSANVERRGKRSIFREEFRRFLAHEFPGWRIAELSTEVNLEYSLSPVYPRALLKKGGTGFAALAVPPVGGSSSEALSFGLIWLDHLRHRERRSTISGLVLFVPEGQEHATCLRLRWLDPAAAQYRVFAYSPEGFTESVDLADYGNLDTRLDPCAGSPHAPDCHITPLVERLASLPGVECVRSSDGSVSLRVRGIEFVRTSGGRVLFGIDRMVEASERDAGEIERLAQELARFRSAGASDHENPLYRRQPERWLESQVRAQIDRLDASIHSTPVYGQVPAFTAGERGVIDLLAADVSGRLAVIELKASEDIHLPVQALDYWMRVRWHVERNDFTRLGYFPGIPLANRPPRLLLIAPSLEFHPTTETILRYFSPEIPIERIGLAVEWRRGLRVVFRFEGARKPV